MFLLDQIAGTTTVLRGDPGTGLGKLHSGEPGFLLAGILGTRVPSSRDPEAGVLPGVWRNSIPAYFSPTPPAYGAIFLLFAPGRHSLCASVLLEGVQPNWNRAKVFTEQEVMNFTSQRFLSPSISEYPTLEEDSSPMKNRPEAKPIIGVKRSLSYFQKAQDQEKWPRNYEVMIQSPKPAKPVLHLPQLEASRFSQLQTRN
ncbi:hypothetical protein DY000_02015176 [Brassica cretica]|uniref:Uncharacterized protein n=1 Tax=Brassica cretica TaxID=69181 RepID=A0ABQ7CW05_BRACR|nr:hypothetical protein DY000_02015176 [Brassica cretica]